MKKNLYISVKRSVFRRDDFKAEMMDKEFVSKREVVLKRDNYTCQFCGFRAEKFQEVHHIDDNHSNNDESNLLTTCILCHSVCHAGFSGIQKRGVLIYIDPALNLDQGALNQIVRALWVGEESSNEDIRVNSSVMLSKLFKLSVSARRRFGTSELNMISDFLLRLSDEKYDKRGVALKGLYFLPLKQAFEKQFSYWSKSVFGAFDTNDWEDVSKQKLSKWCLNEGESASDYSLFQYLSKK